MWYQQNTEFGPQCAAIRIARLDSQLIGHFALLRSVAEYDQMFTDGHGSANRGLFPPLGHRGLRDQMQKGRSGHRKSFMHRVYNAQKGLRPRRSDPLNRDLRQHSCYTPLIAPYRGEGSIDLRYSPPPKTPLTPPLNIILRYPQRGGFIARCPAIPRKRRCDRYSYTL